MSDLEKNISSPTSSPDSTKREQIPSLDGSINKFGKSIENISAVATVEKVSSARALGPKTKSQGKKRDAQNIVQEPVVLYIPDDPEELKRQIISKINEEIFHLTQEADKLKRFRGKGFAYKLQQTLSKIRKLKGQLTLLIQHTVDSLKTLYKGFFPAAIERPKPPTEV